MDRAAPLLLLTGMLVAAGLGCGGGRDDGADPGREAPSVRTRPITQGPLTGEVTPERAVVWARAEGAGTLRVVLEGGGNRFRARRTVGGDDDYVGKIRFSGLEPGTDYRYAAWVVLRGEEDRRGFVVPEGDPNVRIGRFTTPPAPETPRAVTFAFGSDLAGQNVCRDAELGFPIFEAVADADPAFFLALGDMIYADAPCRARGRFQNEQIAGPETPATTVNAYRKLWRYTRSDDAFRELLSKVPFYATWDDHEVVNDVSPGGGDRLPSAPGVALFPRARRAFREHNAVIAADGAGRGIYRRIRWGAHVDVFLLDTRSFRDRNEAPDDSAAPKTMLGEAQRRWLVDGVTGSQATWKIVASSVPLAIPTGEAGARDGWADGGGETGFEEELLGILRAFRDAEVRNLLFLSGDVHFATVLRHQPFPEESPGFTLREVVVGPLSAGLFPREDLDETLHPERRFLLTPPDGGALPGFRQAIPWMTFGRVSVNERGLLEAAVVAGDGTVRFAFPLRPHLAGDGDGGEATPAPAASPGEAADAPE